MKLCNKVVFICLCAGAILFVAINIQSQEEKVKTTPTVRAPSTQEIYSLLHDNYPDSTRPKYVFDGEEYGFSGDSVRIVVGGANKSLSWSAFLAHIALQVRRQEPQPDSSAWIVLIEILKAGDPKLTKAEAVFKIRKMRKDYERLGSVPAYVEKTTYEKAIDALSRTKLWRNSLAFACALLILGIIIMGVWNALKRGKAEGCLAYIVSAYNELYDDPPAFLASVSRRMTEFRRATLDIRLPKSK